MKFDSLKTRQAKSGAYMTVYVLVAFAILAAVNFLAVQYNKSYDATKDKLYSLSDQTLKVLHNLDRDVKIYYFDKKTQFQRARDMLTRYSNATTKVSVEYIDPDSRPEVAQAMNVRTYGTVFVEMGPTREEAKTTNEEDVTNAIIKAIKGKEKTACLLAGPRRGRSRRCGTRWLRVGQKGNRGRQLRHQGDFAAARARGPQRLHDTDRRRPRQGVPAARDRHSP